MLQCQRKGFTAVMERFGGSMSFIRQVQVHQTAVVLVAHAVEQTALLQSVARLPFRRASNGTLLNMKFLPAFFQTDTGIRKFTQLLRAVCALGISHIQFNVLNEADLRAAQREPEKYRGLTVRVAGYTAYFTELAPDLQDEIIARRAYEGV